MKNYRFLLSLILAICVQALSAQTDLYVRELRASALIPVYEPVKIDSLDVNKKAFEWKHFLETVVDFDQVDQSRETITANSNNIFELPYAPFDRTIPYRDKAIQLLSFIIDADRYCKTELTITTTDLMEVYVDGKKEKTIEEQQDSLSKANSVTINLTLEPQQYRVVIKRMARVKNYNEHQLKILLSQKKGFDAEISLATASKRRLTINDILEGDRLASASLSPSGNYYLVTTNKTLPGGKSMTTQELRELKTNAVIYRFPAGQYPQWMPGVDQVVYSQAGQTHKDLLLLDVPSLKLSTLAKDIRFDSYRISPDRTFMIVSLREEIPADSGDLKRLLSPSDRAGSFRGRSSLYLYSFADRTMQRLTYGRTNTWLADIAPDSKTALVYTAEEMITERPFSSRTLMEINLHDLAIDTLFNDPYLSTAVYSPNAKSILLTGGPEALGGIGAKVTEGQTPNAYDTQAYLYDRKSRETKAISKDFNPSIASVQWAKQDGMIYFRVDDQDYVRVYCYNPKSDTYSLLDLPEEIISSFRVADKQGLALFRGESGSNAYRLYSYDLKSGRSSLLLDPFKEQLDELTLSPVTDWTFTSSSDGSEIDGRYYLPHNFDPSKKYPLIVYYYGGTSPTTRVFESTYPLQTYAALGYVVYTLQPSGTTGYGQEFSARHVNAWGKQTADEIIEGTQLFCEAHPFVDTGRIGCIGASYGGFMTQYLITCTDLFKAAISHAGISSIASYWGEGYWGYSYSGAASANSFPWNNPDMYTQQSPLFHADKINTPLLLLHGTVDTNVPVGESIQLYNALKILGKEVEFIQVQGENHIIYDYKKRIAWNKTIHAWFARWLKDQPQWWEALYPEV